MKDLETRNAARIDKDNKLRLKIEQETKDLNKLLSTPEGERFVISIIEKTKLFEISFTGNSNTFFIEGKRAIGKELIEQIKAQAPDHLLKVMTGLVKKEVD